MPRVSLWWSLPSVHPCTPGGRWARVRVSEPESSLGAARRRCHDIINDIHLLDSLHHGRCPMNGASRYLYRCNHPHSFRTQQSLGVERSLQSAEVSPGSLCFLRRHITDQTEPGSHIFPSPQRALRKQAVLMSPLF